MGLTKSEIFTEQQNQLANLAKAIGHPARVAIINYLLEKKSCICKDIVGELPLAQPTISQHLKELKKAGLIKGTVEGNAVCYCLDEAGFAQLSEFSSKVLEVLGGPKSTKCC